MASTILEEGTALVARERLVLANCRSPSLPRNLSRRRQAVRAPRKSALVRFGVIISVLVAAAWAQVGNCLAASFPDSLHFSINTDGGTRIGYSDIYVTQQGDLPGNRVQAESKARIFYSYSGIERIRDYECVSCFEPGRALPWHHQSHTVDGDIQRSVEIARTDRNVLTCAISLNDRPIKRMEGAFPADIHILDGNSLFTWIWFFRDIEIPTANPDTFRVFIPEEGALVNMWVISAGLFEMNLSGRMIEGHKILMELQGQSVQAFVTLPGRELCRLELMDQNLVFERSAEPASRGCRPLEVLSKVFYSPDPGISDPDEIGVLEAKFFVTTFGEDLKVASLNSARQDFRGTFEGGVVAGSFEVRAQDLTGFTFPPYPPGDSNRGFQSYLDPEIGIESDYPEFIKLAQEITSGCDDLWEAAVQINYWVHQNIKLRDYLQASALESLHLASGDSGEKSKVAVALLRAAGIPARLVAGLIYLGGATSAFGPSAWLETYMGSDIGWVPMDPTLGQFLRVDATHVALCSVCSISTVEEVEIMRIEESAPDPLLSGYLQDSRWEGGRQIQYDYFIGGMKVGFSSCKVAGTRGKGTKRTWRFQTRTKVDLRPTGAVFFQNANADLDLSNEARPLFYKLESAVGNQSEKGEFRFEEKAIYFEVRRDSMLVNNFICPSAPPYLLDRNMIGHWAILCSMLKPRIGASLEVNAFVPQMLMEVPVTFTFLGKELNDSPLGRQTCFVCEVQPLGERFWISETGDLVRILDSNQGLDIQLRVGP